MLRTVSLSEPGLSKVGRCVGLDALKVFLSKTGSFKHVHGVKDTQVGDW